MGLECGLYGEWEVSSNSEMKVVGINIRNSTEASTDNRMHSCLVAKKDRNQPPVNFIQYCVNLFLSLLTYPPQSFLVRQQTWR